MAVKKDCDFYFGSHGCDLPKGHGPIHQCGSAHADVGLCSEYNELTSQIRQYVGDDLENFDGWTGWHAYGKGWYGLWLKHI